MSRPRVTRGTLLAPVLLLLVMMAAACSGAPEEQMLRQYFRASQMGDNQTLANFALASLDPKTDGAVTSFDITSVTPERVEQLRVSELSKAVADAEAAQDDFSKRMKTYQDSNLAAIDRVLKAESAKRGLSGGDAAVQSEWTKFRDESGSYAKKVSEARSQLAEARPAMELSLAGGDLPDLATAEGELISKDVMVDAAMRMPDGSTTEKPLIVTMQRVRLKTAAGERVGRWVFTSVRPA